jgi:hypothetical protein
MSRQAPKKVLLTGTATRDHAAVIAWGQLSPEHAEPARIELLKGRKEKAKRSAYRLVGAGPGGSNVIAKRGRPHKALGERAVYCHVLPRLPLPRARYYGYVETADGHGCWLFLEDVGNEPYSPDRREHRRAAGEWLGVLHTTAARVGPLGTLPKHGAAHYLRRLHVARENILGSTHNPALANDDRAVLRALLAQCEAVELRWERVEQACDRMPQTLVHGDFTAQNIRVSTAAPTVTLLPFDWGQAGWSQPCVDLAQSPVSAPCLAADADLDAYCAIVREHWEGVDLAAVHCWSRLGTLFRILLALQWSTVDLQDRYSAYLAEPLIEMRLYRDLLDRALQAPELA